MQNIQTMWQFTDLSKQEVPSGLWGGEGHVVSKPLKEKLRDQKYEVTARNSIVEEWVRIRAFAFVYTRSILGFMAHFGAVCNLTALATSMVQITAHSIGTQPAFRRAARVWSHPQTHIALFAFFQRKIAAESRAFLYQQHNEFRNPIN